MSLKKTLIIASLAAGAMFAAGFASSGRAVEPARVATVDTWALVQRMLNTEAYQPAREALGAEWTGKLESRQAQLEQLRNEIEQLAPTDAARQPLIQKFQGLFQEFERTGRDAQTAFEKLAADQAIEAFGKIRDEAVKLAKDKGYSHLLAGRMDSEVVSADNVGTVTQEILARPILLAPEADDLTETIRVALNLPVELPQDEDATGAAPAADPTAPAAAPAAP